VFLFYAGPKFTITNFNYIILLLFYILIIISILKYNTNKFIYKYIIKKYRPLRRHGYHAGCHSKLGTLCHSFLISHSPTLWLKQSLDRDEVANGSLLPGVKVIILH